MMDSNYALIMAGGGGTRLWPLSRKETPKQMLELTGDNSVFHNSVKRLYPLFRPESIFIVTGERYVAALQADTPEIPAENFIVEPYGKDSSAAAGLGIAVIQKRDANAVIAILTADHHITREDKFRDVLATGFDLAREGQIITLGISPTSPATGFGYIKQGQSLGFANGLAYFVAERFTEKPDIVRATRFVTSGQYSWNSGMFIWSAQQAMQEFERQQPEMHRLFTRLQPAIDTDDYKQTLQQIWEPMPRISLDFAIMENAPNMVVIPVDIGWSDIGSWDALFEILPQDKYGNANQGENGEHRISLDTRNTLIYSDRLVVTIGTSDLILIDSDDAILICQRGRSQDVKEIVQFLRENGIERYL